MADEKNNSKYIYIGVIVALVIILGFVFISNQQKSSNQPANSPNYNPPSTTGNVMNEQRVQQQSPPQPYCGDGSCNNAETCSTCSGDCGQCKVDRQIGNRFAAQCCYDEIAGGVVLYGKQIIDNRLTISGDHEYANFFEIYTDYSGFSKGDVSDFKAYCDHGGEIEYPDVNSIESDKIVLDFYKNAEDTSTDGCIMIVNFKDGTTLSKEFTIKMIGSKY